MNGKSERKRVVVYWVKAPGPKPMSFSCLILQNGNSWKNVLRRQSGELKRFHSGENQS